MPKSFKNKRVLLTYGPTWVAVDAVRVISNVSSGQLGKSLAILFKKEGVRLTILQGPVQLPLNEPGMKIINYRFFHELEKYMTGLLRTNFDIVIHAAAVSDYRPAERYSKKLGSHLKRLSLNFVPTPKLINRIKKSSPETFLVGFKLEPDLSTQNAADKVKNLFTEDRCDLVVANSLKGGKYSGYVIADQNRILETARSRTQMAQKLFKTIKRLTTKNQRPATKD